VNRRPIALWTPIAILLFASGCGTTPTSQFYTLSSTAAPAAPAPDVSIAVGPVSVPAEVDRPQFVVSIGANQVQVDEFNRWAAPLNSGIASVVAENLSVLLGTPHVTLFPQALSAGAQYRVAIAVQSFVSTPGASTLLDASWTVFRTKDRKTETGRSTVKEPVQEESFDALAAAHSRALERMSQDIAAGVRALDPKTTPLTDTESITTK